MKRSLHIVLSFAFALLLLTAAKVSAQTSGEITGLVTDSSGAAVSGATVSVTSQATGAVRRVTTNNEGLYSFPSLLPGDYELKVEQQGFKTALRGNIQLQVQQTARIDFTLEVGSVGETVTVTGGVPLLATESNAVGTVIENKRIVDLPLNGRNFLQLVATAPNVSFGFAQAGQSGSRQGGIRSDQQISVAGQRSYFNRFTIDGVENTDVNFNTPIMLPSIDALQEFKVQTGIFPAEFGRATTQINVSMKSGARDYHGALFEFLRNDYFDAREYDILGTNSANTKKNPFKWNQYGFVLGGPVWLPKKLFGPFGYENRERIFFMTNFESFRQRQTLNGRYNLPPTAWRTGDFSALSNPIFDPTTGQQFAGNKIPTNRIHPTSIKLLEFYPAPNLNPAALGQNHQQPNGGLIDRNQFNGRGDFIESERSSWAGRYSWTDEIQLTPGLKLNGTKLLTTARQVMASNTRTLTTSIVNEARFGYNSFFNSLGRELAGTRDVVKELAIPGVTSGPSIAWGIPSISVQGFAGFGDDSEGPYVNTNKTFQVIDNLSWTKGSHSFRFGGEVRWDQYNQVGNQFARGAFLFEPTATTNKGASGTGNSFADFLLGYCKRCEVSVSLATIQFRAFSQYYYIDDSWKVRPNLTLNFGLRYENTPPWLDKTGRLVNVHVPFADQTPNVADLSRHPTFVRMGSGDFYEGLTLRFNPAIKVARDGRLGERLIASDNNDFAPRFGMAWSPTSKWTVRMGGGGFYSQDTGNPRFDMARNLAGRRRDESTPTLLDLTWNSPFRNLGGTVQVNNPYTLGNIFQRRTPYIIQYMLSVQRELRNNLLLEVNYLGSVGRKLESLRAFNESIPGTTGSVLSRAPYPEFGRIQEVDGSGKSSYNGFSVKLEKRLSGGLSFVSGYTWSKSIDNASAIRSHNGDTLFPQNSYNLAAERALSSFHTSHRAVNSVLYQLPFGKGKRFMDTGGVANVLLGGWEFGTLFNIQSGFPLTVTTGRDQSNIGAGFDRPNNVAGQVATLDRGQRTLNRWFNTDAFEIQPFGTFGNVGRNTIISPGIIQWDASMLKSFRFAEGKSLQFRFEAFNAANHPNWGNPGTGQPKEIRRNADGTTTTIAANANFGKITGMRGAMRQLQFGLKLIF
ncbi:MAG: carboxypeptidase regulatory-like domain-containing protein [Acidobacteria bacterium]|nr:carboxypeptidase regulatory-like domain-containing protein [Acidobacteriota bacterium]